MVCLMIHNHMIKPNILNTVFNSASRCGLADDNLILISSVQAEYFSWARLDCSGKKKKKEKRKVYSYHDWATCF